MTSSEKTSRVAQFSPEAERLIRARQKSPIYLKLAQRQGEIIFQVQDNGIGIPLEDQAQLFEPFHRGRNVSNIPGTGLGLSLVKQFVDLLEGSIDMTSEVEMGTTFTVKLPVG